MKRVLCFGEILLRLSPSAGIDWIAAAQMPAYVGGAELNVAMALGAWGVPVGYCTAAPESYLADSMLAFISQSGVDTSAVLRSPGRIGVYYLQQGVDLQHNAVIYDRQHSSFFNLRRGHIHWDQILENVSHFHFSAISPALGEAIADVCLEAVEEAARRGIVISIDLNYRPALWDRSRDKVAVMNRLVNHCSLVMGNIWSANALLGVAVDSRAAQLGSREALCSHAHATSLAILQRFPSCSVVANTFRFNRGERGIEYFATIDNRQAQFVSRTYASEAIVDRVGSGDCFMAGLLFGNYNNLQPEDTIALAAKAAVMKMHERGDSTRSSISLIQSAALTYEQ